jgi:hypothetical protein
MKVTLIGTPPPWKGVSAYATVPFTALADPADLGLRRR